MGIGEQRSDDATPLNVFPPQIGKASPKLAAVVVAICFGLLSSTSTGRSAENSVTQVRILELNGTKLYVPVHWALHNITVDRAISEKHRKYLAPNAPVFTDWQPSKHLKPGERAPEDWGSPTRLDGLILNFCASKGVLNSSKDAPFNFELVRSFDAPEIPADWCIGFVSLVSGEKLAGQNSPLGPGKLPAEAMNDLGPIDQNGFRVRNYDATTNEGTYYGFKHDDVSPDGGAIVFNCSRAINGSNHFRCGLGSNSPDSGPAIPGIRAQTFDWLLEKIEPGELRQYFWRSQSLLNWLATPPDQRPSKIGEK